MHLEPCVLRISRHCVFSLCFLESFRVRERAAAAVGAMLDFIHTHQKTCSTFILTLPPSRTPRNLTKGFLALVYQWFRA